MADRIVVLLPDGRALALGADAYRAALEEGARLIAAPASPRTEPDEPLLDSEELAAVLKLPVTWIEQAAREHRIPSVQAGRWRRFRRSAVERTLSANGREA